MFSPYASWLSSGDNAWQMTAATLVGLMSIPALAVLYGGIVQKKWAVNTMMMVFSAFCLTLIVWVLWAFKMGFGTPWIGGSLHLLGKPQTVVGSGGEQSQASIPLLNGLIPKFRFPEGSLVYFQFVFAAITPILFIGSVVGRIKFSVWLIFVPLWITFAYAVNAFLLWGGGYWAGKGALDFSGGYVIHLAAGVSGFVAAAVVGPRLKRDREKAVPNNLLFIAVGAGILWLGWNGFNGGDPYFAGADATAAVVNTNLATACAMMTWIIMDMAFGKDKKPTFLGGVNGMICGLVGITPAAGYVNGVGAIIIGVVDSALVWILFGYLPRKVWPFNKVDDALGVVYTHGFAGLFGGLHGRPAGRPEDDRLPRHRQIPGVHHGRPVLRPPPAVADPGGRGPDRDHLGWPGHVPHPARHRVVHEAADARRRAAGRRHRRARRGGLPGGPGGGGAGASRRGDPRGAGAAPAPEGAHGGRALAVSRA